MILRLVSILLATISINVFGADLTNIEKFDIQFKREKNDLVVSILSPRNKNLEIASAIKEAIRKKLGSYYDCNVESADTVVKMKLFNSPEDIIAFQTTGKWPTPQTTPGTSHIRFGNFFISDQVAVFNMSDETWLVYLRKRLNKATI